MQNINRQQNSIDPWELELEADPWQPEEVPPRKKLIWFICQRIKRGITKEQLLEIEVPQYIEENNLPMFPKWDVSNMIDWAIRKVGSQ